MIMNEQHEKMYQQQQQQQQQQQTYKPLMILSSDESLVALASPLFSLLPVPVLHDNISNQQQVNQNSNNTSSSSLFLKGQKQKQQNNNFDDTTTSTTNATTVTTTSNTTTGSTTSDTTIIIGYQINIWNADNEQLVTSFEYRHKNKKTIEGNNNNNNEHEDNNLFPTKILFLNTNNTHLGIVFNDIINVWDISLRRISYEIRIAAAASSDDTNDNEIDTNINAIYDVIPFQSTTNNNSTNSTTSSLFVLTAPAVSNKTRINNHHNNNCNTNTIDSASIDDTNSFHTIDDNSMRIERTLLEIQQQQQLQQQKNNKKEQQQQQQQLQQYQTEFDLEEMQIGDSYANSNTNNNNYNDNNNNNNTNVVSICCWWQQILEFDSISGRFIRPVAAWECSTYDDMITAKLGFCSSYSSNSIINTEEEEQYLIVTSSSTVRVFNPINGTEVWNLEHKENYDCFNTGTTSTNNKKNRLPFFLGGGASTNNNNNNVVLSTTTGSYVAIVQDDDCNSIHHNNNNANTSMITSNHYNNLSLINIINGTVLKHNSPSGTNIYTPSSTSSTTSSTLCQLIEGTNSNNCLLLRVDNHIYAIELVHSGSIIGIDDNDDDDDESINNNNNSYKIRKRTRLVMNSSTDGTTIDGNNKTTTTTAFVLRVNHLEQTVEVIAIDTTISIDNQAASFSSTSQAATKLDGKKNKKRINKNSRKSKKQQQQQEETEVEEETALMECICLQQYQFEKFTLVPLNNIMALENGDYIDIDSVTTTSTSTSNSSCSKQYQQQQQQQQILQQFHNSIILPDEVQPELAAAWFSKRAQQVQEEAERKKSSAIAKPTTVKRSGSLNTNSNHSRNGSTGHEMLQASGSFADSIINDDDYKIDHSTASNGTSTRSSSTLNNNNNMLTAKSLNLHLHNTNTEKANGSKQQQHPFNYIGNGIDEDSSHVSTASKAFSERTEKTEITSNMMFLHSNSLGNSINNNIDTTNNNPFQNTADLVSSLYLRKTKSNMTASSDGNVTDDEEFLPIRSHNTSFDYSDENNNNNSSSSTHTHNVTYSGHYRKILVDTPTRSIGSKTLGTVGSASTPGESVISTSDVHNRTTTTISTTLDRTTNASSNRKSKQRKRKSRPLREWIVTFGIPLFFIILVIVLASVFTTIAIRKRQKNKSIEAQVADTLNDDDRLVTSVTNGVTRRPPTISPAPSNSPSPSSSIVDGNKDDDGMPSSATVSPIPTPAIIDDDGIGSETSTPTTPDFDRHNSDSIVDRNTSNIVYSTFTVSSSSLEQFIGITPGELFGTSVDISSQGNILAISSPVARIDGNRNCGKVDIFERQNQQWVLRNASSIVKVTSGNNTVPSTSSSLLTGPGPNSRFGTLLSMNANGSIVAVSLAQRNASRARQSVDSVNMYKFDIELQEYVTMGLPITLNDTTDHKFGSSFQVSSSGRYIVVGSPNVGNSTNNAFGMVSVYMFNDLLQDWTLYGKQLFGTKSNDALGTVVTIYEDTILGNLTIAASAPNTNYNRGYVKVWRYNTDKQAWVQLGNSLTYDDVVPTNVAATKNQTVKTTKSIFGSSLSLTKIFDNERRARFVIGLGIPVEEETRTNFSGSNNNSNSNNNSSKIRQRTFGRAAVFELRKRSAYTIPNTSKVSSIKSRYWSPIGNSVSSHIDVDTFQGYIVKFLPPSNEDSGIILAISTPGTTTTKQTEAVQLYHAISPFDKNSSITTWEQVDGSENLLTGDARNDQFGTSITLTRTTDSIVVAVGAPQTNQPNSSGYVTVFTIN